jgi:hypothetical protein
MKTGLCEGTQQIVAQFGALVNRLCDQLRSAVSVRQLEQQVRDEGRRVLCSLLRHLLQSLIDAGQERLRACPDCGGRRRHQGVRERRLNSSLGTLALRGIYFKCTVCGACQHGVDLAGQEQVSALMKDLMLLAGVSSASFDKAQVVSRHLLGVDVDDEAIRQLCLREGRLRDTGVACAAAPEGADLVGSCDGTMVNTRQDRWREVKAMQFRHAGGVYAAAYLEDAHAFAPRLRRVADRLGRHRAGRCIFVSDCAEWIGGAVKQQLPGFLHVADYFHATQHVHAAGERVYGRGHPDARKWSASVSRRLRERGAATLSDKLRRLALFYRDVSQQRAVLDLCRYLDKHAAKMDYGRFRREQIPIDSGAMESFCKQLGLRLKGPGMRWNVGNVNAMANLVSRWVTDPGHAFSGASAA